MNIFIMILVVLFMGVYYVMSAPSQRTIAQETEYAIEQSDLKSVAECTAAVHNAQIKGNMFDDICVDQNGIRSRFICLNDRLTETGCEIVKGKKPAYSYIVTATAPIDNDQYNNMMEILERSYTDAGTFGMFSGNFIVTGGDTARHTVPAPIISNMELQDGSLVYLTQYELPDNATQFAIPIADDVTCPSGTVKTYRFGRWQCIPYNTKTNCTGDMVWDSDLMTCVADDSRRPLCSGNQTAVMIDDIWECVDPFADRVCPSGSVARLNYENLEWECVSDPNNKSESKKCDNIITGPLRGGYNSQTSCNDCEKMITDTTTCESYCVPDPDQVSNRACYSGGCGGADRGFYFGFPSARYVLNVDAVAQQYVPFDATHSQNRRFNCMDCSTRGGINREKSFPPYVTVCNQD